MREGRGTRKLEFEMMGGERGTERGLTPWHANLVYDLQWQTNHRRQIPTVGLQSIKKSLVSNFFFISLIEFVFLLGKRGCRERERERHIQREMGCVCVCRVSMYVLYKYIYIYRLRIYKVRSKLRSRLSPSHFIYSLKS